MSVQAPDYLTTAEKTEYRILNDKREQAIKKFQEDIESINNNISSLINYAVTNLDNIDKLNSYLSELLIPKGYGSVDHIASSRDQYNDYVTELSKDPPNLEAIFKKDLSGGLSEEEIGKVREFFSIAKNKQDLTVMVTNIRDSIKKLIRDLIETSDQETNLEKFKRDLTEREKTRHVCHRERLLDERFERQHINKTCDNQLVEQQIQSFKLDKMFTTDDYNSLVYQTLSGLFLNISPEMQTYLEGENSLRKMAIISNKPPPTNTQNLPITTYKLKTPEDTISDDAIDLINKWTYYMLYELISSECADKHIADMIFPDEEDGSGGALTCHGKPLVAFSKKYNSKSFPLLANKQVLNIEKNTSGGNIFIYVCSAADLEKRFDKLSMDLLEYITPNETSKADPLEKFHNEVGKKFTNWRKNNVGEKFDAAKSELTRLINGHNDKIDTNKLDQFLISESDYIPESPHQNFFKTLPTGGWVFTVDGYFDRNEMIKMYIEVLSTNDNSIMIINDMFNFDNKEGFLPVTGATAGGVSSDIKKYTYKLDGTDYTFTTLSGRSSCLVHKEDNISVNNITPINIPNVNGMLDKYDLDVSIGGVAEKLSILNWNASNTTRVVEMKLVIEYAQENEVDILCGDSNITISKTNTTAFRAIMDSFTKDFQTILKAGKNYSNQKIIEERWGGYGENAKDILLNYETDKAGKQPTRLNDEGSLEVDPEVDGMFMIDMEKKFDAGQGSKITSDGIDVTSFNASSENQHISALLNKYLDVDVYDPQVQEPVLHDNVIVPSNATGFSETREGIITSIGDDSYTIKFPEKKDASGKVIEAEEEKTIIKTAAGIEKVSKGGGNGSTYEKVGAISKWLNTLRYKYKYAMGVDINKNITDINKFLELIKTNILGSATNILGSAVDVNIDINTDRVIYISIDKNETRSWEYENIGNIKDFFNKYKDFHLQPSLERADSVIQTNKLLGQLHTNLEELKKTDTGLTSTILKQIIVIFMDIVKISKIASLFTAANDRSLLGQAQALHVNISNKNNEEVLKKLDNKKEHITDKYTREDLEEIFKEVLVDQRDYLVNPGIVGNDSYKDNIDNIILPDIRVNEENIIETQVQLLKDNLFDTDSFISMIIDDVQTALNIIVNENTKSENLVSVAMREPKHHTKIFDIKKKGYDSDDMSDFIQDIKKGNFDKAIIYSDMFYDVCHSPLLFESAEDNRVLATLYSSDNGVKKYNLLKQLFESLKDQGREMVLIPMTETMYNPTSPNFGEELTRHVNRGIYLLKDNSWKYYYDNIYFNDKAYYDIFSTLKDSGDKLKDKSSKDYAESCHKLFNGIPLEESAEAANGISEKYKIYAQEKKLVNYYERFMQIYPFEVVPKDMCNENLDSDMLLSTYLSVNTSIEDMKRLYNYYVIHYISNVLCDGSTILEPEDQGKLEEIFNEFNQEFIKEVGSRILGKDLSLAAQPSAAAVQPAVQPAAASAQAPAQAPASAGQAGQAAATFGGSKRQRVKKRHTFKIRDVNGKTYTLKRKPRKNRKNRKTR